MINASDIHNKLLAYNFLYFLGTLVVLTHEGKKHKYILWLTTSIKIGPMVHFVIGGLDHVI